MGDTEMGLRGIVCEDIYRMEPVKGRVQWGGGGFRNEIMRFGLREKKKIRSEHTQKNQSFNRDPAQLEPVDIDR
jgi:hypothetical protein